MKKTKVVIVGAGFAGLSVLIGLLKSKQDLDVKIIEKDDYFEYTPSLHLCITDQNQIKKITFSLKKHYPNNFIKDEVVKVKKHCVVGKKREYEFDYLVVATGSKANFFGNKSFEKFGIPLRRVKDAKQINKQLKTANDIVVIGGGYTGVEIASVLADETNKNVTIVHSADKLLNTLPSKVSKIAKNYLEKRNVTCIMNERAAKFTKNSVELSSKKKIKADLIIFSAGIMMNDSIYGKRANVGMGLNSVDDKHIFFCGDVVKTDLIATAHNAMIEGRKVAHNLICAINGKDFPVHKHTSLEVLAVALGKNDGVITFGKKAINAPLTTGLFKKAVEKRVILELKKQIVLPL